MDTFPGFPRETLKFLYDLKRHNDRTWFLEHKAVYEQKVKAPMIDLVVALGNAMQGFAPEIVVDPKHAIYRIHRDTRFSPDKTPYKTHVAAHFRPRGLPKDAAAGLYFHVAPDEIFIGGGVYMPGSAELKAIRSHIAEHAQEFRKIIAVRKFKELFGGLEGEQLSRAPKGFLPDHPAIDLLRYKQFLAGISEKPAMAETPQLFKRIVTSFAALMPFIRFLNTPLQMATPAVHGLE